MTRIPRDENAILYRVLVGYTLTHCREWKPASDVILYTYHTHGSPTYMVHHRMWSPMGFIRYGLKILCAISNTFSGLALALSALPVSGSMTSASDSWTYRRSRFPSRGMSSIEPSAEWMTPKFRASGKSVSGSMSITPQMKSSRKESISRSMGLYRLMNAIPDISPSMLISMALRVHECAPTCDKMSY